MLGSVERSQVLGLLQALADGDGEALLARSEQIAAFSPDFAGVLNDTAGMLHRIQLRQLVPQLPDEEGEEGAALAELAGRMEPQDVQLYYQFATRGREELNLAPDARTGFDMVLLRMLAFAPPAQGGGDGAPASGGRPAAADRSAAPASRPPAAAPAPQAAPRIAEAPPLAAAPHPAPAVREDGLPDWELLIERAGLRGPLRALAINARIHAFENDTLELLLDSRHADLAVEPMTGQMAERIGEALGRRVRLRFIGSDEGAGDTPAARAEQQRRQQQNAAEQSMQEDPLVQQLKREFGARVVPQSVRPLDS